MKIDEKTVQKWILAVSAIILLMQIFAVTGYWSLRTRTKALEQRVLALELILNSTPAIGAWTSADGSVLVVRPDGSRSWYRSAANMPVTNLIYSPGLEITNWTKP